MRFAPPISVAIVLTALVAVAYATVVQPNGAVMPIDSMNGEVQLYTLFGQRGEPIDYQTDASGEPSSFLPLCGGGAELVLQQTASSLAIGWYNVGGDPPAVADIHEIIPAGAPIGTVVP